MNRKLQNVRWHFINYGFADHQTDIEPIVFEPEDEGDRYFIQLYHHLASGADLQGKKVLEAGSGRGGGSSYIARYLGPTKVVGLDRSSQAVRYCNKQHQVPNLLFKRGDAERLPFESNSFDVVINVESSHCYGSMSRFLQEVQRVLRPGGFFLWADFREETALKALHSHFVASGMNILKRENITQQVLLGLDHMNERKVEAIDKYIPAPFISSMLELAGVKESAIYRAFQTGEKVYLHYVCRNP